jgi:hypothetical protein
MRGDIVVSVKLYDSEGMLIAQESTSPKSEYVGSALAAWPGQLVPVAFGIAGAKGEALNTVRAEVSIKSSKRVAEPIAGDGVTRDLTMTDLKILPDAATGGSLTGTLTNNSKHTLKGVHVLAVSYDAKGRFTGGNAHRLVDQEIKPGDQVRINMRMYTMYEQPAGVEYVLEGHTDN